MHFSITFYSLPPFLPPLHVTVSCFCSGSPQKYLEPLWHLCVRKSGGEIRGRKASEGCGTFSQYSWLSWLHILVSRHQQLASSLLWTCRIYRCSVAWQKEAAFCHYKEILLLLTLFKIIRMLLGEDQSHLCIRRETVARQNTSVIKEVTRNDQCLLNSLKWLSFNLQQPIAREIMGNESCLCRVWL